MIYKDYINVNRSTWCTPHIYVNVIRQMNFILTNESGKREAIFRYVGWMEGWPARRRHVEVSRQLDA